ncbi:S9 family peptidase [Agarilytica rhodophyticola]|uniref:S9 family peptidase n=1 Tax=Agarilytica rhodophyticola TaxID=1737490 RepID=UPI00131A0E71|nr:S9 family peptidase [Agarilytica rhodophyticola]
MTAVDVLNIPSLSQPHISPDGKSVIYTKFVSDWEKNKQIGDIWLSDIASKKVRQLTFDVYSESNLQWSPDGKFISFVAEREKDDHKRLYLLPLAGGEAFPITDDKSDILRYTWTRDSRSIYFLANEPVSELVSKRRKKKDDMQPYERALTYRHIWKLNVEDRSVSNITSGKFHVTGFDLSSDNRFIAYNRSPGINIDDAHNADIWFVRSDGKNPKQLTDNNFAERRIQISPDNKKILFISDINEKGDYFYDANIFILSIANGKIKPLALDQTFEVESARWAKNGKDIYIQANMGVRSEIWALNAKTGKAKQLTDGEHTVKQWHYDAKSNKHLVVLATPKSRGDIWLMSKPGSSLRAVTEVFAHLEDKFLLPQQKIVRWKSHDGVELEGLLSLPLNYQKGKRYPMVLHTHGGPRSSDQYGQLRWRTYIPLLAAMDYVYFSPNYRGGRGYGDEFMRDTVGKYFNNMHLDVMSGIDHLIEQGIVDPNALIATGWSAGGHLTNKLITHTNRFKAASSGAGAVDWVSMYGHSDVRYSRTPWFGGTPWQKDAPIDVYRENSPLKDLWKVTTPTIIFVGGRDRRVPAAQSIMLYHALQDLGVESTLYIAPREPHGYRELRHRLFKINAELEWFERHVRERQYTWQHVDK